MLRRMLIIIGTLVGQQALSSDTIRLQADTVVLETATKTKAAAKTKVLKPHLVSDDGYRLQVIKTRDRLKAIRVKGEMLQRLQHNKVYLVYKRPYFRVRIGNFITKKEADQFKRKHLSDMSPVYTVKDKVVYMWYPPG